MARPLDEKDRLILDRLKSNARTTLTSLAEAVDLSMTACRKRVKHLEAAGYISRYTILTSDPTTPTTTRHILIKLRRQDKAQRELVRAFVAPKEEVILCDFITGEFDIILILRCSDGRYSEIYDQLLRAVPLVERTLTCGCIEHLK